ncbi:MAG: hypothetical protein AB1921_17550 [Thermodesulfobacteriota bacterium]
MKAKCAYALAAAAVLIVLGVSPVQAFDIGAKAYYWYPKVTGDLKVGTTNVKGTMLDLQGDLDFNQEGMLGGTLFLKTGKHHLAGSFCQINYESDVTLRKNVAFAGDTFTAGSKVKAELIWSMADLEYGYDILDIQPLLAGATVTLLGRLKFFDAKSRMELGGKVSQSSSQPAIPMLGASAKVQVLADLVSAEVAAVGMGYSGNLIVDGTAEVSITPLPFIGVHAGWRYLKLDLNYDETDTNSTFSGPYGYLSVSF